MNQVFEREHQSFGNVNLSNFMLEIKVNAIITSHLKDKFTEILDLDGINLNSIGESLNLQRNKQMVFKSGESEGKSGSFFFFSQDNKFLIKTMTPDEKYVMIKMMSDYVEHIKKSENKSLLARIYGMFTISSGDC